jgi:HAMP domain-containing protein
MSIARRTFLKSATMTTLSAGLAFGAAHLVFGQRRLPEETRPTRRGIQTDADGNFRVPIEAEEDSLFYFRPSTFTPYVGDIFQVPNALGEMIELKLTGVSEYKVKASTRISTRKARQPQSFSLTFIATKPLPPFTSIYQVSHPALGQFDLFLISSEPEPGSFVYEATFNHIR